MFLSFKDPDHHKIYVLIGNIIIWIAATLAAAKLGFFTYGIDPFGF